MLAYRWIFSWIIFLGLSVSTALANAAQIIMVSPPTHYAIVHRIESTLYTTYTNHPAHPHLSWIDPIKLSSHNLTEFCNPSEEATLIVTVGPSAFREVMRQNTNFPVLAILLYQSTFEEMMSTLEEAPPPTSAIYLDQPFDRTLLFMKTILPIHKEFPLRVGMVWGEGDSNDLRNLQSQAKASHIALHIARINENTTAIEALRHVLHNTDALLSLPNTNVLNTQTARGTLLTAYRYRVPVIGYSQAYVRMGALAALFVTPKQVAQQTTEYILKYLQSLPNHTLSPPEHAAYFTIAVNYHVANLLGLHLPSELSLQKMLEDSEITYNAPLRHDDEQK